MDWISYIELKENKGYSGWQSTFNVYFLNHKIKYIKLMHIDDSDKMNGPGNVARMKLVRQCNYQ